MQYLPFITPGGAPSPLAPPLAHRLGRTSLLLLGLLGGLHASAQTPLSGTYYVGTSAHVPAADFPTLTAAAAAYNSDGLAGPATFVLLDASYPSETLPITFSEQATASATNTLTIKPDVGVSAVIRGSSPVSIIKLNGADYVTLDGSNSGSPTRNLTLVNNSTANFATVVHLASPSATNGATHNVVQNLVVVGGSNNGAALQAGIGLLGADPSFLGDGNNDNTIRNNQLLQVAVGIDAEATAAHPYTNLVLADNEAGPATAAPTDNLTRAGLLLVQTPGVQATHNTIRNVMGNGSNIPYGIALGAGSTGALLERNVVRSVHNVTTGGYGVLGIIVDPGAGAAATTLRNNVVADVWADGDSPGNSVNYVLGGIGLMSGTGYALHNNSVQLSGDRPNNVFANKVSAALFVATGVAGIDARNNVLSNIQTTSDPDPAGLGTNYAVYARDPAANPFTTIDYNLYDLRSGAGGRGTLAASPQFLGHLAGADIATLAAWQAATGQDRSSMQTVAGHTAGFTSALNLAPNPADPSAYALNGTGVQLAGLTLDLAGNPRPTTVAAGAPDLGAYEFTPTALPNALEITGTYAPGGTQNFFFNSRPVATITYAGTGTLPDALTARYFPGTSPPSPSPPTARYQNSYFTFETTGASGAGYSYQLVLSYDPALLGPVTAATALRLSQLPAAAGWRTDPASTVNPAARTLTSGVALTAFGTFTGSDAAAPLPVELAYFEATRRGPDADLAWGTASEKNNRGFEVQVSADGREFRALAWVAGAGTSTAAHRYAYLDREPDKAGSRYYRLRQLDRNGTATFSPVRALGFEVVTETGIAAAPNPYGAELALRVQARTAGRTTLTATDALGRTVLAQELAVPAGLSQPDVRGLVALPPGLYVLRLVLDGQAQQLKIVRQ